MRKAFGSCVAAFMGYAAIRAFGHEDYAGVYFHGLTATFAAADLLKASQGNKEYISSNDFSTPSVAVFTSATAGVSLYALTIGSTALEDPVDVILRGLCGLGASLVGAKILKDRVFGSNEVQVSPSSLLEEKSPSPKL